MHKKLFALPLIAVALLSVSSTALAHFPWIVVQKPYSAKPRLECFFAEGPEADDPDLLRYVAEAKVWSVSRRREPVELKLTRSGDSLWAALKSSQVESLFLLQHDLGVFDRGDSKFLLRYYGKTGPALSSRIWQGAETGELADLDVVPAIVAGQLRVTVLFKGKPAAGAEVTVYDKSDEHPQLTANDEGIASQSLEDNVVHAVRVKYVEKTAGERDGKKYPEIRHYATVTFPKATWRKIKTNNPFPELPELVTSFGAAVAGDHLYVYGGHRGEAHSYSTAGQAVTLWSLNLKQGSKWKALGHGPKLQGLAMVAHEGKLYRIGGFTAKNGEEEAHDLWSQAGVSCFDPKSGKWTEMPSLPEPRSSFDAAVLGNTLYVVGGWKLQGESENQWHETALSLDLSKPGSTWKALPKPPFQRRALAVAAYRDKIFAIGGMQPQGGPTTRVAVFDPETSGWSEAPRLVGSAMTGFGASAFAVDDKLYVSTYDGTLQRLSRDEKSWEVVGNLDRARFFHRMLPINSGRLVLLGGASMSVGKFGEIDVVKAGR